MNKDAEQEEQIRLCKKKILLNKLYNPEDIRIEEKELAYIAGLFDGEVALSINKNGPNNRSFTLQIRWMKKDYDILKHMSTILGGKVSNVKKQPNSRFDRWQWCIYSGNAYRVLRKITPFLRIKKKAAGICIDFYEHFWRGHTTEPLPPEIREVCNYYMSELRKHQSKPGRSNKPLLIRKKNRIQCCN